MEENGRIMFLSNCAVFESKKLKFIKQQQATELLSTLGIKTPFSKVPLEGSLLC